MRATRPRATRSRCRPAGFRGAAPREGEAHARRDLQGRELMITIALAVCIALARVVVDAPEIRRLLKPLVRATHHRLSSR